MADLRTDLRKSMSTGMVGGTATVAGLSQKWTIQYSGSVPVEGDTITLHLVDSESAEIIQAGSGFTSGIVPSFCMTHNGKVYMLAGSTAYFSAVNDPETWNANESEGNGFVNMTNQSSAAEDLVAAVPFQGRLAFFSRNNIHIWQTASDPAQWSLQQTMQNIGTIAAKSVQPTGFLDALFLADTGIRSLRAREVTLNALVDDIGSPLDTVIQDVIVANPSDAADACGVVEPSSGRYWLFLKDTIYVLSHYPSSQVLAWSTYEPKDSAGDTFAPQKMFAFQGKVYLWDGNSIYVYGGSTGTTYDTTLATFQLPWSDLQRPGHMKSGKGIQTAFSGTWALLYGMDPRSADVSTQAFSGSASSFNMGAIPITGRGSHFSVKGTTVSAERAVFSSLVFLYEMDEEL